MSAREEWLGVEYEIDSNTKNQFKHGEIVRQNGVGNICNHELLGKPDCLGSLLSRRRRSGVWANHRPVFSNSGIGCSLSLCISPSSNLRFHVFYFLYLAQNAGANPVLGDCDECSDERRYYKIIQRC